MSMDPAEKRRSFERLKELAGNGRLIPEPRKGFTRKQREEVYALFEGQCGCGCEESLDGEAWDIDHAIPIALGGKHELANWVPRIKAHHVEKTKADVRAIAKAKRLERRALEGPKPAKLKSRANAWPPAGTQRLASRPFPTRKPA